MSNGYNDWLLENQREAERLIALINELRDEKETIMYYSPKEGLKLDEWPEEMSEVKIVAPTRLLSEFFGLLTDGWEK